MDDKPHGAEPTPSSIVGIGASAGGLEAFSSLLNHLPTDSGMAFVLVQHLDPEHESALTQILSRVSTLPVEEIADGQRVLPDHVYIIPRDRTLTIARGVLQLTQRPGGRAPHRPIDIFFESLAQDQRDRAIGVVLSGTASDGTLGLEAIKGEGGITMAQDESAKHDSMPRSAIAAGVVDLVLAPADIASELGHIARHPHGPGRAREVGDVGDDVATDGVEEQDRVEATAHQDDPTALPSGGQPDGTHAPTGREGDERKEARRRGPPDDDAYRKVMLLLRNHSGVDFSLYKSSTIQRRISRRMILTKHHTLEGYAGFLKGNAQELDALYSDVLISVTSFFRNPEAFDALQREVLPILLDQRTDEPLRCWVLGCSTGQEAYSIAMACIEAAEKAPRVRNLQIFATDLNEKLLAKARHGLYARTLAEDVSPDRLRRFFVEEEGGYRVTKTLRDMVVFARHNLINDPPFSRLDLISCRNLMIYLEPSLQRRALPTFHYALKPGGYLMLGVSESVGGFTELFEPVDKKHRIYVRKPAQTPALHLPAGREHAGGGPAPGVRARGSLPLPLPEGWRASSERQQGELGAQREADRIALSKFAPPSVLIDDQFQVLQFRGQTGAYLEPPPGKASFDLLKMAREGLQLPLRAALQEAKQSGKVSRRPAVHVQNQQGSRSVDLEVIPLKNAPQPCFLVMFQEAAAEATRRPRHGPALHASGTTGVVTGSAEETSRIDELEAELSETREYLQSMQDRHEASSEELQAANEEVQSANEELQSINEELETSKEELESANEELSTVNEEMSSRNDELTRLNNDLVNLQASIKTPIVLLGRDLRIRRFSPQAEKLFDLLVSDVGRPIGQIQHNLVRRHAGTGDAPVELEAILSDVIASVREQECEVQHVLGGRWYSMHVRPYLTSDNRVDGAVLMLVDIDDLKKAERGIAAARDYAENTIATVREPLLVLDQDLRVESANRAFYRVFRTRPAETIGRFLHELGDREWDLPKLRELLVDILPHKSTIEDFEVEHDFGALGTRTMLLNARQVHDAARRTQRILLAIEDISERKRALRERGRMQSQIVDQAEQLANESRRKDEFLAMLSHELRNPLAPIRSAVHLLRTRERADEDPITRQAHEVIERQVGNLTKLVRDLLEVSRVISGRIRLDQQVVDLTQVVQHAIETVTPLIQQHSHEIVVHGVPVPLWTVGDATRLEEVFVNLLDNASKYTTDGGRIEVSCERSPETGQAEIRIRDNGIGITPELLPRIFDLFTQADHSLARAAGGLGIGLSLARRIVELHGGTIEAHSPPRGSDVGTEFVVRLTLTAAPAPARGSQVAADQPQPASLRVLVVDDNMDQAAMLSMLLEAKGYSAQSAHSGTEALKTAEKWKPDVILLDIGLPDLDGYEIARRIRAMPERGLRTARLIAITGYGRDEDIALASAAGFDSHLTKPIVFADLEQLLRAPPRGSP